MAKQHPRYEGTDWPEWEFREFPMMVYPGAADQKKPYGDDGRPLAGVIVNTPEEADAALGIVREAPEPEVKAPAKPVEFVPAENTAGVQRVKTPEDEREELLAEAEQLGVVVDKRWSVARIQDAIDTKKADTTVV